MPIHLPSGRDQDVGLQRITSAELFPAAGVPLHVNKPMHSGDGALHDHEFLEIAFMVDGHAVHRTIHGEQAVSRGDLILLHPGQWHAYEKAHDLVIFNCCFGVDLLMRELAWARTDPVLGCLFPARLPAAADRAKRSASQGVMALRLDGEDFTRCMAELEILRALLRGTDTALARGDIVAHLLLVLGLVARAAAASRKRVAPDDLAAGGPVAAAVHALEEQLEHDWSLAELAARAELNRSYFVRRFRRATGLSPMAYLARRRAEKAAVLLLTTTSPIAAIGRAVGWRDPNYFARRFRAAFAMSAREYRAQLPTRALIDDVDEDRVRWPEP